MLSKNRPNPSLGRAVAVQRRCVERPNSHVPGAADSVLRILIGDGPMEATNRRATEAQAGDVEIGPPQADEFIWVEGHRAAPISPAFGG
jgi:hypothetical protein